MGRDWISPDFEDAQRSERFEQAGLECAFAALSGPRSGAWVCLGGDCGAALTQRSDSAAKEIDDLINVSVEKVPVGASPVV